MNTHEIPAGVVHNLLVKATTVAAGASYLKPSVKCTFQAAGTTTSGTGSATVKAQASNNDTDWLDLGTITLTLSTTSTSDGFTVEAPWRYVRGNVTAISGTGASVDLFMGT